ncbi:putative NF-X1 finger and helicase domain protein [Aspergillus undulatus]|uniref:putative NF-X1 finger and helicase domain protein n=1 Tax=Aspergillus undulatus TaxID=1810928 RepID=UPI003CCE250A
MHSSIARLVRETLYPGLRDAPDVVDYPSVTGMKNRLFWMDHRYHEEGTGDDVVTTSHWNNHEIGMTVALANHLLSQGDYRNGDIAVLTPYLDQLHRLRQRLSQLTTICIAERDQEDLEKTGLDLEDDSKPAMKSSLLDALRVATIDNFQSEEAKIVVISLVRSNHQNRCGFLSTSNRINVLLSRSQHGMYIIGNSRDIRTRPNEGSRYGHQCPSVCCEQCPPAKFCQICAQDGIKSDIVDFIRGRLYKDIDLTSNPCIFPRCGHFLTRESMDAQMDLRKYYVLSEKENPIAIKDLQEPFRMEDIKNCALCRGSLGDISRYGRLVRQGLLDESTKKLILCMNREYIPLAEEMARNIQRLHDFEYKQRVPLPAVIRLGGHHRSDLIQTMKGAIWNLAAGRWDDTLKLRQRIDVYAHQASPDEQPFIRVLAMVESTHRRQGQSADKFEPDSNALQVKGTLLATALSFRLDKALLTDFRSRAKLTIDLSEAHKECETFIDTARESNRPPLEAEGHLFIAQLYALERCHCINPNTGNQQLKAGLQSLKAARNIVNAYPSQTCGLESKIDATENMFFSTFYSLITNAERFEVVRAMAAEFVGTGHWYYCANGHPFTIGECGGTMQESMCPECGVPIGGSQHRLLEGVSRAEDLEGGVEW